MANAASPAKERLSAGLLRVIEIRRELHADAALAERWLAVKHWQSGRLARTYPDLLASKRYRAACEFFLDEIYGAKDFESRDQEALRVVPKLARMLPERAVETMALAVELDVTSESLDARLARAIRLPIDAEGYSRAYRTTATLDERRKQVDSVVRIGLTLEKLARIPLLSAMLRMMRAPAEAAGFGHLHRFLQNGFDAFRSMGPASEFLRIIEERETALMNALFAGRTDELERPELLTRR